MELKDTNLSNETDYSVVDNQEVEGADSKSESNAGEAKDAAVEHTDSIDQKEKAEVQNATGEKKNEAGFFDKVKSFITDPKNRKLLLFIGIGVAAFLIIFFTIAFIPVVKYGKAPSEKAKVQYLASGENEEAYVTGIKGLIFNGHYAKSNVKVKDTYKGAPVVGVASGAFKDSRVKNVTLPDSVKYIGSEAFAGSKLQSINLPAGLESIGEGAFQDCKKLKDVNFPDGVKSVGANAFNTGSESFNLYTNLSKSEMTSIFAGSDLASAGSIIYVKKYEVIVQNTNPEMPNSQQIIGADFGKEPDFAQLVSLLNSVVGYKFRGLKLDGALVTDNNGNALNGFKYSEKVGQKNPTITVVADFYRDFTVTYNVNGGDALASNTQTVIYGESYKLAVPTWTGHTFLGWYDGETKIEDGTWNYPSDLNLVAHWKTNVYTISYNVNGGDALISNTQSVTYGDAYTLVTPTRFGYDFLGWYNGTNKFEAGTWNYTESVSLVAHWSAIQSFVYLDVNGGNPLASTQLTASYGSQLTLPTPTWTGYTFLGWYEGENKVESGVWEYTSDKTLVAHWEATKYTITYDVNGGDALANNTQDVTFGETYTLVTPTRYGYDFGGWALGANIFVGGTWNLLNSIELVAQWNPIHSTIYFDVNGGDPLDSESMDVYYGQTLSLPTPTRTGYRFGQWLLNYTEFSMTTYTRITDTHLLADWCILYYAITYDVDEDVELSPLDPTDYTVEDPDITLHNPTRYGYDFVGWSNGGVIPHGSTGEKVFTATWSPIPSTIILDVYGGDPLADSSLDVNYGLNVTLPTPTWTGHTFLGWYDGENKVESGAWEYIENVTLLAHWELIKYQVTLDDIVGGFDVSFNLNGASGQIATQRINSDNSLVYPSIPEREDYIFGGWYDNVECSGDPFDFSADVLADVQLYAKWVAYEDATPISFATSVAIHVNSSEEDWAYYAFVPLVTGSLEYEAQSVAPGYHIDLCNGEKEELDLHDRISGSCTVTAGELYYLRYQSVSEEFDFFVSLEMEIAIPEDGGANSEPNKEVVLIEYSSSYTLPVPAKYGYAFEGWYDGEGGTGTQYTDDAGNSLSIWTDLEDKTLYAKWSPILGQITFEVNGGDALLEDTLSVVFDEEIILPDATRTGYTFVGWYCGEKLVENGPYRFVGDSTFVAHWEPNKYQVELNEVNAVVLFDKNDGTGIIDFQYITFGDALEYLNLPNEDTLLFGGWYDNPDCVGEPFDFYSDIIGSVTLYAKWIDISSLDWELEGTLVAGDTVELHLDGATYHFYAFVPLASGNVAIYSTYGFDTFGALYNADLVEIANNDDGGEVNNFRIVAELTAGEVYYIGARAYSDGNSGDGTITIDATIPADGGSLANDGILVAEVAYDSEYQLLVPVKYGYNFLGWFDGEGGTGTQYTDAEGNSLVNWTLDEDLELYPAWEIITSTITLNVHGGDALLEDMITLDFGDELTLPTPTRTGYRFLGWFDGEVEVQSGIYYGVEDCTLIAEWDLIIYSISYDLDGGEIEGENPTTYTVVTETINLISPSKYGYNFLGWDNGGTIPQGSTGNLAFVALWEAIASTITLDVNDGDALLEDKIAIAYEEELELPTPTRTGYDFVGWFDGEEEYTDGVYYNIENITLVAHWEAATYDVTLNDIVYISTISFDLNGAEGTIPSQSIKEGVTITYPEDPTRDGFIFGGWYDNPEFEGELFDFSADIEADVTLYAKWVEVPEQAEVVTFVGDTFEAYLNGTTVHYYAFIPLASGQIRIKSTYGFDTYGYLYNASLVQLRYDDDGGGNGNFLITYDVTAGELYFIGARAYSNGSGNGTIEVSGATPAEGGTHAIGGSLIVGLTYDEAFSVPVPERIGYTFDGWYDDVDGTGNKYTDEFGNGLINWDKGSATTLYAKWIAIPTTITLDVNGGDALLEDTINIAYDDELVLPTPTFTGHDFLGWYNGEELVENGIYQALEDVTLVAHWENSKYNVTLTGIEGGLTVSFDTNGGNEEIESQFVTLTTGITYPNLPTKDGYVFAGWYDNPECEGEVFDFTQAITSELTLYAKWLTYEGVASAIVYGENTINIIGGGGVAGTQFFAFVPLETCRVTITVGKDAWIGCSSNTPNPGATYSGSSYGTTHYDVVAGRVYYISLQSNGNVTNPSYIGEAYLNISGDMPADGGLADTVPNKVVVIAYEDEYTLDVPTRYGYTFLGWFDGEGGTGTQYTNADGTSIEAWTTLTDKILYPKFVAISSVITLDVNEGDALLDDTIEIAYDDELVLPTPTRTNYSFLGWYDGETLYESGTYYGLEDVTLVAQWTEYEIQLVGERTTGIYYTDELNSESLHVKAIDTDGTELEIAFTLTSGTIEIGNTITVSLRVEGKFGTVVEETMADLKVYGDSTLTYDDTLEYINEVELADIPAWFSAVAVDTFDTALTVVGVIIEEEYAPGEIVTIKLSAVNAIGREVSVQIDNIKLYDIPDIQWDNEKLEMRVDDVISLELFGISCVDSFGDPVDLTATPVGTIEAGNTITISVVARDNFGNVGAVDLNVKVYGAPSIVDINNKHVKADDELTPQFLLVEAYDSFNNAIDFENITIISIDGVMAAGNELTITVSAVDHLGNENTEVFEGIMVCGDPVITYDETLEMMSDIDPIDAEFFRASAVSTFGEELDVEVAIATGELIGGTMVTFTLTATDEAGNITTVTTGEIKVYSADTITFEYDDVQDLPIKVTSKGEEYHAVAYDSFGGACEVELVVVGGSPLRAGNVFNVQIVATDLLGNVALSDEIINATIYDTPTISYEYDTYYILSGDDPASLFKLLDSFENEIVFNFEVVPELSNASVTACHITGTDEAGNVYDEIIILDIVNENETVLHIYINGDEIQTVNQSELTEYTLPRYTGYTTSWIVNDVDLGDDALDYVIITHDGSAASIYAYGTKVANVYDVTLDDIILTAVISFDLNGAEGTIPSQSIKEGVNIVYPDIPSRDGYIFAGWYESPEGEGEIFDFSANIDSDVTLYAKWIAIPENVVAAVSVGDNFEAYINGQTVYYYAFVPLASGQITITSSFSKDSYGYLYNASLAQLTNNDDGAGSGNFLMTYNVVAGELYFIGARAYSSGNSCNGHISLTGPEPVAGGTHAIGGSLIVQVTYDALYTLQIPERTGYIFHGWYDGVGGTGTKYTDELGRSLAIWDQTDNLTLYANWEAIETTITLDVNGGDELLETEFPVVFDGEVTLPTPTRTGYDFLGWYDGETLVESGIYKGYEDATLVAQWEPNKYTVTLANFSDYYYVSFDLNGAEGEIEDQFVTMDDSLVYPELPTRTNYLFGGWYDNPDCDGEPYDFTANVDEDKVLYAKWLLNEGEGVVILNTQASLPVPASSAPDYFYYAFVPLVSGNLGYTMVSYSVGYYVDLCNSAKEPIAINNTHSENVQIVAGELYYLRYRSINDAFTIKIRTTFSQLIPEDGGLVDGTTITLDVAYDEPYQVNVPKKNGYNFIGWFDGVGGTGTQYTDALGQSVAIWNDLTDKTLYPKWEAIETTITLDVNGGDELLDTEIPAVFDSEITLPIPTRTGYTFLGWYGGETLVESGIYKGIEDVTLVAHWEVNRYRVTLDGVPGGHEIVFESLGGTEVETQIITNINPLVYPTIPTKDGFIFGGWYETDSFEGEPFDFSQEVVGDVTIYAKWVEAADAENSILAGSEITVTLNGSTYICYPYVPLVSGTVTVYSTSDYDTYGIFYNADKSSTLKTDDDSGDANNFMYTYEVTAGTLYYIGIRAYSSSTHGNASLHVDGLVPADGGTTTAEPVKVVKVSYGSSYTLDIPIYYGHNFLGWYDGGGGTGTQYTDSEGNGLAVWSLLEDIRLYAKWELVESTITFNANGGSLADSTPITLLFGDSVTLPTPTKTGYTFMGWYDGEELIESGAWNGDHDVELLAHWTPNTYTAHLGDKPEYVTVSFDLNGADGSIESQQVNDVNGLVYPELPERENYLFGGWYEDSSCTGDPYDFTQELTGDLLLCAKWLSADNIENVITAGEEKAIYINGTTLVYYPFVPLVSGLVTIETSSSLDTYGTLYSATKSQLTYNDDGPSNRNFQFTYNVIAGCLYYIGVRGYGSGNIGDAILRYTGAALPEDGGLFTAAHEAYGYVTFDAPYQFIIPDNYGYHFLGWYDGIGGTGTQYTDSEGNSLANWTGLSDITLYAKWEIVQVTVTYDVNGGDELIPDSQLATYNANISHPTPTRTGYTFLGWYDGEELINTERWYGLSDTTLVAHWELTEYNIYYIVNGGAHDEADPATYNMLSDTIVLLDPVREGYTFLGWDPTDTIPTGSTGDKTFTAMWEAISSTITFDVNGGEPLVDDTLIISYDSELTLPVPTWTGYTFLGWFDGEEQYTNGIYQKTEDVSLVAHWEITSFAIHYNLNGGEEVEENPATYTYFDETIVLSDTTREGYTFLGWDPTNTIPAGSLGEKTFTAMWEAISSTITFDVNGGEPLVDDTLIISYDSELTLPVPTWTGYTFLGWFNGEEQFFNGIYQRTEDVTLVAHWEGSKYIVTLSDIAPSYTVSFDTNGGNETIENQIISLYNPLTYPASPTKEGYMFGGWYETAECTGSIYDFSAGVSGDTILYAKWVPNHGSDVSLVCGDNVINIIGGYNQQRFVFVAQKSGEITVNIGKRAFIANAGIITEEGYQSLTSDIYDSTSFNVTEGDLCYVSIESYKHNTSEEYTGITYFNVLYGRYPEGGTIGIDGHRNVEVTYNSAFTFEPVEIEGYTFLGWYDGLGGTGNQITDEFGVGLANWEITYNISLYAKLEPNT